MRAFVASALFVLTLRVDGQVLRSNPYELWYETRVAYFLDDPCYGDGGEFRSAQPRDRRSNAYAYERQGRYGYERKPLDVASRAMSDVRTVAKQYRIGKRDRTHLEEVEEELGKFTRKYREGRFDKNNLKDAADSLHHLMRSDSIRSSGDCRVLRDALFAVENLRLFRGL